MQAYVADYATNIDNIQSLSGSDIQQIQIYSMDMAKARTSIGCLYNQILVLTRH